MLTYRSSTSFESRFNRKPATLKKHSTAPKPGLKRDADVTSEICIGLQTPPSSDDGVEVESICECERNRKRARKEPLSGSMARKVPETPSAVFAAQSYLQYQSEKFLSRFDANCYIHLLNKMDSHDVTRGRMPESFKDNEGEISSIALKYVFGEIPPRALVISVDTDVLFRPEQQLQLAECLPEAKFADLESSDGHDGFLLEFATLGSLIVDHLKSELPQLYEGNVVYKGVEQEQEIAVNSVFGEAEAEW
jgi:homoserine O-acetyltransferase